MPETKNRERRRRAGGNGGKVDGGLVGGQLSTVSTGEQPDAESSGLDSGFSPSSAVPPDPEVPAKATRRQFSAKYKLKILEQADACTEPGEVGRLLRREGLHSSHLANWRQAKLKGSLQGLEPRKRGRKAAVRNPLDPEVDRLKRQVARLEEDLRKAHIILDVQGNLSKALRPPLGRETRVVVRYGVGRSDRQLTGAVEPEGNMVRGWLRTLHW